MRWGLVPCWAKDPAVGDRQINARAATAADRPAFRQPFRERRCRIPADGFYEWQRQGTRKQPSYIRLASGEPVAGAGLWDCWASPEDDPLETCTILTTNANDRVAPIHDRMPVILPAAAYGLGLDRTMGDAQRLQALLIPYPADAMTVYPVRLLVNNPRIDTPGCIEPLPQAGGVRRRGTAHGATAKMDTATRPEPLRSTQMILRGHGGGSTLSAW